MTTHDHAFADRPDLRITKRLLYDYKDVIFSPYGEQWRQRKSICVLQLLNNKRVGSFKSIMEDEVALLAKRIRQSPGVVNFSQLVMEIANNVICRAAVGRRCRATLGRQCNEVEEGRKFFPLLRDFLQLLGTAFVGDFIPWLSWISRVNGLDVKVNEVAKEMDMFLEDVIQAQKIMGNDNNDHDKNRETFVDVLLDIHQNESADVSIDRDSVKAIIMEVIVAGTNSSSSVLEWSMSELLLHPEIMRRLQDEVRSIMNDKHDIKQDDLEKMCYLKAVIKETLRFHTPVPLSPRIARQDVNFMGYDVSAGTMVINNAWAIAMDPNTWDKPEIFNPDRFMNSSVNFKAKEFEMIPFGAGRRGCPGTAFAMAVTEIVLANLVHKFNWRLLDGAKELDMTELPGVVIHRAVPLIAVASAV